MILLFVLTFSTQTLLALALTISILTLDIALVVLINVYFLHLYFLLRLVSLNQLPLFCNAVFKLEMSGFMDILQLVELTLKSVDFISADKLVTHFFVFYFPGDFNRLCFFVLFIPTVLFENDFVSIAFKQLVFVAAIEMVGLLALIVIVVKTRTMFTRITTSRNVFFANQRSFFSLQFIISLLLPAFLSYLGCSIVLIDNKWLSVFKCHLYPFFNILLLHFIYYLYSAFIYLIYQSIQIDSLSPAYVIQSVIFKVNIITFSIIVKFSGINSWK